MVALTALARVTATPAAQGDPFISELPFGGYFLEKVRFASLTSTSRRRMMKIQRALFYGAGWF